VLRYETEPGLVAFYDIRPGNGADSLFLQPWSPQGASYHKTELDCTLHFTR